MSEWDVYLLDLCEHEHELEHIHGFSFGIPGIPKEITVCSFSGLFPSFRNDIAVCKFQNAATAAHGEWAALAATAAIIEFRLKWNKCIPCSRFYDNRNKHNQREIYSEPK